MVSIRIISYIRGNFPDQNDFLGEELAILRRGCFKYFERGGDCITGPVSLLSGSVLEIL